MEITKEMLEGFEKGNGKRITTNGETKNYPTYKIPLNYLIFNEENGRIITEISQYRALHPDFNFEEYKRNDLEGYKNLLKDLIEQSSNDSKKSFYETKDSIKINGQKEAGVILSDGRIIDGNRRFACLLELYQETKDDKFAAFETAWFPAPSDNDLNRWKLIKQMEHNLQFNVDPIRNYSRINLLDSFYYDTLCPKTRLFTKKEYCDSTGMKESDYDKDKKVVEVMLDYLQFIGHPCAFWIIKQEKLETALEEIANEKFDPEEWTKVRESTFILLATNRNGDIAKNIKKLVDSVKKKTPMYKEYHDQFYDEVDPNEIKEIKSIISDKFNNVNGEISSAQSENLNKISKKIDNIFSQCKINQEISNLESEPIMILNQLLKEACNLASNDAIMQMKANQEEEFKEKLGQLETIINKIKQNFN